MGHIRVNIMNGPVDDARDLRHQNWFFGIIIILFIIFIIVAGLQ
jgi:hypothetical protein